MSTWDVLNVNQTNEIIIEQATKGLSHVFLLEQLKSYQVGKSLTQRRLRGPATWKDMFENALSDTASWQTKKVEQLYKVSSLCLDDHQFKQEELESVGELSQVCSQMVLKCLYMARIGGDQTFHGLSTNLQEQFQSGLRHATDD